MGKLEEKTKLLENPASIPNIVQSAAFGESSQWAEKVPVINEEKRRKKKQLFLICVFVIAAIVILAIVVPVSLLAGKNSESNNPTSEPASATASTLNSNGNTGSNSVGNLNPPTNNNLFPSLVLVGQTVTPAISVTIPSSLATNNCSASIRWFADPNCLSQQFPSLVGSPVNCNSGTAVFSNLSPIYVYSFRYYPQVFVGQVAVTSCPSQYTDFRGYNSTVHVLVGLPQTSAVGSVINPLLTVQANSVGMPNVSASIYVFSDNNCVLEKPNVLIGGSGLTSSAGIVSFSQTYFNSPGYYYIMAFSQNSSSPCNGPYTVTQPLPTSSVTSAPPAHTTAAVVPNPLGLSVAVFVPMPMLAGNTFQISVHVYSGPFTLYTGSDCVATYTLYSDQCITPIPGSFVNMTCAGSGIANSVITMTHSGTYYALGTGNGIYSLCSNPLTITPTNNYRFTWNTLPPTNGTVGQPFNQSMVVLVTDNYGNNITTAMSFSLQGFTGSTCTTTIGSSYAANLNTTTSLLTFSAYALNIASTVYFQVSNGPCVGPTVIQ
ncbi:hypothetical protein HDV06_002782 [Boothiomyces sp. JEL0866]|nr:hypothetical protein HDV06_002782 [Boothiomyces sp. JEL0866]